MLQSKQKSRSYSFDSMNRDKRHFVHEYCEHFGCESVAYDQEPKRNVVATAARDKVITIETVCIFSVLKI
jgi:transcriptional repressor NF-X1